MPTVKWICALPVAKRTCRPRLDALDYQLNPDTEALGWARLADAISPLEVTPITDASAGEAADDQEGDEEEGTAP